MKIRLWKKVIALFLCVGLLVGNLPVYAAEQENNAETPVEVTPKSFEENEDASKAIPEEETESEITQEEAVEETTKETAKEMPGAIPEEKAEEPEQELPKEPTEAVTDEIPTEPETMAEPEKGSNELEVLATEPAFLDMYAKIFGAPYSAENAKIIYVAGTAPKESSASKGTKENPYVRLQNAYEAAGSNTILYLQGDYTSGGNSYEGYGDDSSLNGGWLNGNKPVLIAADENIALPMKDTWSFGANTGLYRVGISLQYAENTNREIYCNGHTTIIGGAGMNNIQMSRSGNQYYPTLFGGSEDGTTVASTDLTVNGGIYDRIYGGGRFGSSVTGEAKLIVDGKVDGNNSLCSVSLVEDKGLENIYIEAKSEDIIGGGATDKNRNYGSVGSTSLTVANLHNNGKAAYVVVPNGGAVVDGAADVTVENSKIVNLWRGYGEIKKEIAYHILNSEISHLNLVQQYSGIGLETGAKVTVQAKDSTIKNFWARQANAYGSSESTAKEITQNFTFQNCNLQELYLAGNYNSSGPEDICELDNCRFVKNGYIYGFVTAEKETLIFKNMEQEIVSCDSLEEAKKISQSSETPTQVGMRTPVNPYLEMENTKVQSQMTTCNLQSLKIDEKSTFSSGNLVSNNIGGTGILKLSDGSAATFSAVEDGTRIHVDAWGEIKDKVKITAQCKAEGDEFVYEKDGLHLLKIPGEQISFWYLSAQEISYDQSRYVYVDQKYGGTEQDGTLEKPFSTLEEAYKRLTPKRNQIVLMSSYVLKKDEDIPRAEKMNEEEVIFSASDELNDFSEFAKLLVENETSKTYVKVRIQNNTTFTKITIGGQHPDTESGRIQLYANGYKVRMAEGSTGAITGNNTPQVSVYGSETGKTYEKVDILIEDGYWGSVGSGEGIIGTKSEVPENKINPEILTNIQITGGSYSSLNLSGTTYGSVNLSVENARSRSAGNNFQGVVYGNTSVSIKGKIEGSSYGDRFYGTYYGDCIYDTREAEKYDYYYSLTVAGTYYQEAEFFLGKHTNFYDTGGVNIAGLYGNNIPLVAYAPINITIEEGAINRQVFASGADKAEFHDTGCVNLYAGASKNITTAADGNSALNYQDKIYKNFHLYLQNSENTFSIENLYGFETITVEEGANISVGSKIHTKKLELQKNAKLAGADTLTVGMKEQEDGALKLGSEGRLELLKPLYVYGTAEGVQKGETPGTLSLDNPLYEEEEKELYSRITRDVTGNIQLFTKQMWTEEKAQKIYLNSEASGKQFVYPSDEIVLKTQEESSQWVCRFGNKKDYSVIYLDGTAGNDDADGLAVDTAVKTLERAYELVTSKGTILVSGPTEVTSWEGTMKKPVIITSCNYNGKDTTDYRLTNQAVLTMPANIVLKEDTTFACVTFDGFNRETNVNAAGYAVVFGVEKEKLPEGIENFSNKKTLTVNGADSSYRYPTSIIIHSGKFGRVDPWTNDKRGETGEENKVIISFKMTGGSVDTLGVGTYTRPVGIAEYTLTGGKVKMLGSQSVTSYASKSYDEIYHIQGDFQCDAFYTSVTSYNTGNIKIDIKNLNNPLPLICYGNKTDNTIFGSVEVTVENAVVQEMQGGTSTSAFPDNNGAVSIHLKENAKIENLHCGSQGSVENLKKVSVYMEDETASIGNLYANGISGKLRPQKVELFAVNGEAELPINFLREEIDLLQIGQEKKKGYAAVGKEDAQKIGKLSVNGNSKAEIENGTVFGGDYKGSDNPDTPALWKISNASSIEFQGEISGYTEVTTGSINGFQNGFTIRGGSCQAANPERLFTTKQAPEGVPIAYDNSQNKAVWSLPDSTDSEKRNTVYISMYGNDANTGAMGTPVKTLAEAYERVAELKKTIQDNLNLSEEEKAELIAGISICVLDSAELGEMKPEVQEEIPDVEIKTEDPTKNPGIVFTDAYPVYRVQANTTFENITFYNNCHTKEPVIYAQGYEVVVNDTVTMDEKSWGEISIYGGSDKAVASTNLKVLGGNWKSVYGGGKSGAVTGNVNLHIGGNAKVGYTDVSSDGVYGGGDNISDAVRGNVELTIAGGDCKNVYGGGKNAPITGKVTIDYQYGNIASLYGGGLETGANVGNIDVSVGMNENSPSGKKAVISDLFRGSGLRGGVNTGGKVIVKVGDNAEIKEKAQFCAGGYAGNVDSTELIIQGGTINTSVYGGGWGDDSDKYGKVKNTTVEINGGKIKGNVYAGGNNGLVEETAKLQIHSGTVTGNLYGGGNAAGVVSSQVNVEMTEDASYTGNIFGGSYNITQDNKDIQKNSVVNVTEAKLNGNIFAGSDTQGKIKIEAKMIVSGNTKVTGGIFGGGCQAPMEIASSVTVGKDAVLSGNVYGGGQGIMLEEDGVFTSVKNGLRSIGNFFLKAVGSDKELAMNGLQDANVPKTNVNIHGTVNGDVYGGGELATTGTKGQIDIGSVTNVTIADTAKITGDVYGGGKGKAEQNFASIYGDTMVTLNGVVDSSGSVYGGGESAPVKGTASVSVTGGTASAVYGGGNQASVDKSHLKITAGNVTEAYAGGNASTVSEKAELTLDTGKDTKCVTTIYGGNNQAEMNIQPTINLIRGKCDTFYGGGNQGAMTVKGGLKYGENTFDSNDVTISTVYGGCNNADVKDGVELTISKGNYDTIYGGNNAGGEANSTHVILDEKDTQLQVNEVYGGGNKAPVKNTHVTALNGDFSTISIYGGGNEATVTEKAVVQLGNKEGGTAKVGHLYGGNNNQDMAIQPEILLLSGKAANVYGGCNRGKMTAENLSYTFRGEAQVENLYGGCNEADVEGNLQMILDGISVEHAYGGCNTSGQVPKTNVIVRGNNAVNVYGGGRGQNTFVETSNVEIQKGTVLGNVYGGSGHGAVKTANVIVKEQENEPILFAQSEAPQIQIDGNVFGGGYGVDSVVEETNVTVDMKLSIAASENPDADLIVTEGKADTTEGMAEGDADASSGETKTEITWKNQNVSCIKGSVYGGGDMGQVGEGTIHQSTNTAAISKVGNTNVDIQGGYIEGSVFGGGSGTPAENTSYTIYMGTVFGTCHTNVSGGYVQGSIYGCGHQSRVYAPDDAEKKQASEVKIQETQDKSVIIGTSIFGGGNKGEGTNQNASVYTVVGDTQVEIIGLKNNPNSTAIYFLSEKRGGVYGDGNLCLVKGNRNIYISDFNYGSKNHDFLKTFYSLQRADEVTLERTKIVLRGAKDLVDENADETVYAINRVGNLKMKDSSTMKLTTIVKLLGGLESDQNTERVFVDRGNNGSNKYNDRGGAEPSGKLTDTDIKNYQAEYEQYRNGSIGSDNTYKSFNVICVANGDYLELKKSDSEYGNVTGLFTLELLHANPGEGGGFVFANIGDNKNVSGGNAGSTGDFICTTKNDAGQAEYMDVIDNVGGYSGSDYTYYYWYIKGGKYTYNTNLQGYIGTADTAFEAGARMPELRANYHYILNKITGDGPSESLNSANTFAKSRLTDYWDEDTMKAMDAYAVEVQMVPKGQGSQEVKTLGFLAYGTEGAAEGKKEGWYITQENADGSTTNLVGTQNSDVTDQNTLKTNDVFEVSEGVTGLELRFILHKGSGVTVEIKNVPVTLEFDVLKTENGNYVTGNGGENAHVTVQTYTSITRIVPSQAAYVGGGRLYSGVSSDMPPSITGNSAFTAQFITKYVPSAFGAVTEELSASYDEVYLLDEVNGVGFTIREKDSKIDLLYATKGDTSDYTIAKEGNNYRVTYEKSSSDTQLLKVCGEEKGTFTFPKGTMITLVAQMDDYAPTYWYYHVSKDNVTDIPLNEFSRMNTTSLEGNKYSFEAASGGKINSDSSNRVTESLTFVFDFANTENQSSEAEKELSGKLMLRHKTQIGNYPNADIMDFVSESSSTDESTGDINITYTREMPKISNQFKVSKEATGIKNFSLTTKSQEYYEKDTYPLTINIEEDETWMNTQYEEREYAVVLEYVGQDGQTQPFPEGTSFWYDGIRREVGQDNKSVIIPVQTEGIHEVIMKTELAGLELGSNKLKASLYSSSVASYYNSIATTENAEVVLNVKEKPKTSIYVTNEDASTDGTFVKPQDKMKLSVNCKKTDGDTVSVSLYQYQAKTGQYQKCSLDTVFEDAKTEIEVLSDTAGVWEATVLEQTQAGTYRLEFIYEDKAEYWDFIIQ